MPDWIKRRRAEDPRIAAAEKKRKENPNPQTDILCVLFLAWSDDKKTSITDENIQRAIDVGLSKNLWWKICALYKVERETKHPYWSFSEAKYTYFHSWLADRILRVQNDNSRRQYHTKSIVDLAQTPEQEGEEEDEEEEQVDDELEDVGEDEGEEEGCLDDLTAAYDELNRLENFEKSKEDNESYQEYLAVQSFEEAKHDSESYQEYMALKHFKEMKRKNDPLFQEFIALQEFQATRTENPVYQQYHAVNEFEKTKDKNSAYKEYLALQEFQEMKDDNANYKEHQAFRDFEKGKALQDKAYREFLQFQEFKATMDTNPLVKKMKKLEHIQRLMKKSPKKAEETSKTG